MKASQPKADPHSAAPDLKRSLRSQIRSTRRARTPESLLSLSEGFRAAIAACSAIAPGPGGTAPLDVLAFLPLPGEPPIIDGLTALHGDGHRVLLPRCLPERRMEWVPWTPATELVRSQIAPVLEPPGESVSPESAGLVLVPALAIDSEGFRLGQGGGFYDSFLASCPAAALVAGVVYDDELGVGAVPREPWDAVLSYAVTEGGFWRRRPPQPDGPGEAETRYPQKDGWEAVS